MAKKDNQPKWKNEPKPSKDVKIQASPESNDRYTPAWQFHKRDREHEEWGWDKLSHEQFCDVVHAKLAQFETMTWGEILSASGGRTQGNNHHNVPVSGCCKEARKRLEDLKQDDTDELFSLRLTGKFRLWGVKDGRVLRFLWHDPEHTVWPVKG